MSDSSNNQKRGLIFACLTALLWGFLAIALKVAVTQIDPITVSWFRFSFASIIIFGFIKMKKPEEFSTLKKFPWLALVAATGLSLNYIGYITGIQLTGPNNAQIIIQSAPLLLGIIGIVFFKEKITKRQLVGIVVALIGFYFFYLNQLDHTSASGKSMYNSGSFYVLLAALCWVVYAVCQKVLVRSYPVRAINFILFLFSAFALAPLVDYQSIFQMSIGMWCLMLFLGLNTLLAYSFLGEAFKYADANKVGIIITLNPLITIFVMTALAYLEVGWIAADVLSIPGFISAFAVLTGAILAVKSK
ncbi:Permease of the drug/metabolite transporter (DMT) superfamily [Reichenbachiella faecimaris]|uniref:Permease of the drug/metabolite transporter (DMT) superfamily n=1 Tax=Reichenbachiella faecimaris TaxID=692418 RepID=A0A1W2GQM4_REIFA|nr:DMT family transporter [Reichenbachiella faecimaris]SMD38939.1 Permease of the drug/metabolite transporter (DMT) superfamily [Reichenbachiella faecimaris]